jgi:hypothetical protein
MPDKSSRIKYGKTGKEWSGKEKAQTGATHYICIIRK